MNKELKISVIVPCYNQGHFLDQCLGSLLAQTYTNWECILINDGSTDNTHEKSIAWEKRDARIKYFKKVNGGLSSARNYGLKQLTGDYIQFLDCDDFLAPEKFLKSVQKITDPENTIVITDFILFNEKKQRSFPAYCKLEENCFNYESILKEWDKRFTIPIHCALFPFSLAKKIEFDEELKAKEDWIFWLQIYQQSPKTVFIAEPLASYRINLLGMTSNDDFMYENQKVVYQKLEQLIADPKLYHSFLKYNNDYFLYENFKLKKEVKIQKDKRKLKYKIKKVLKALGLT